MDVRWSLGASQDLVRIAQHIRKVENPVHSEH